MKSAISESLAADALAAFAVPTLIGYGDRSPATVPAIARALARLLPRAKAEAIPGATHAMLDTHPEAVAAMIGRIAAA